MFNRLITEEACLLACQGRIITGNSIRKEFVSPLRSLTEAISLLDHLILKPLSPLCSAPSRLSLVSTRHPNHPSRPVSSFSQLSPHPRPTSLALPCYHPQLSSTTTLIPSRSALIDHTPIRPSRPLPQNILLNFSRTCLRQFSQNLHLPRHHKLRDPAASPFGPVYNLFSR